MKNCEILFSWLTKRLLGPLPGKKAHILKASSSRLKWMQEEMFTRKGKESSVLIILYYNDTELHTVYIERASYDGVHSRQIAFPGGRIEPDDYDLIDTAIRESQEEIGINEEKLSLAGSLSSIYIPPSNFIVKPYVAVYDGVPEFIPDPVEVKKVISIPLSKLINPKNSKTVDLEVAGSIITTPAFIPDNLIIWGATAMITSELLLVIEPFLHSE